jgi:glycosyltransferase involved in cell wall biosynthesis
VKPSLLFVSARLPFPCTEGHQLRSFGVLSQLAKHYDVHLLSLLRPGELIDRNNTLGQICSSITGVAIPTGAKESALAGLRGIVANQALVVAKYVTPTLRDKFATLFDQCKPTVVHFDLLPLAELATLLPRGTPWVLNEHNVESDLIEQKLTTLTTWHQRWLYRRELARLRAFEIHVARKASLVLACSDDDATRLREFGAQNVCTIPNGVDAQRLQPDNRQIDSHRLVFLGGMNWYPNRLGMEWFVQEVLPKLIQQLPNVQVDVIGNPEPMLAVPESVKNHVHRLGFVPDFVPYVQTAAAMIVPLHVGSGTRLKVVEGLALGKCMISTRKGAEGVGLQHERNILFADSADEFVATTVRLLNDSALRQRIESAARQCADEIFDWHIIGKKLHLHYAQLVNE